ncbi:unnamed protein product [Bursaphelenchus xylophilus]|uniref:(pine wood nematode) hypothetical protein n=1 Tax=Bursaphelenchus xylophilus TaxID=6326 RepID=A0A7I8WLT3_BURXY|nr:unnamed protein product [Bursaphelenchus xylophilus]CAG9105009.1 unnamed protein product [Bursaphelenchus xylophilus]
MDVCHFAILLYFVAAVLGDQSKGSNKPVFIAPALGKTYLRAQLDLNRPYSVFLHDDCKAAKCSAVVDGVTTYKPSAKELKEFKDDKKYGNYELQGKWYRETLTLEIEFTVNVVAATSANPQVPWLYSGVLGLAPARDSEDEQSSIIKKLLNAESLSAKQLVIQESWKELAKKNKEMKGDADASGLIAIGNLESGRCGSFTTANTDQKSWTFEADIKIGDEKFEKKKIAFMVGQNGVAEDAIFDKHFARTYDKDTELPTISFNVSSTTFELAGKEYGEYNATTDQYKAKFSKKPADFPYDFAFGSEFLQHYCLSIGMTRSGDLEIGLAENKKKPDGGQVEGDRADKKGGRKSAAACSLSFVMASFFAILASN